MDICKFIPEIDMVEMENAIDAGCSLLDVVIPGWFNHINADSLDIGSTRNRIQDQLTHAYSNAYMLNLAQHAEVTKWEDFPGFSVPKNLSGARHYCDFMTDGWRLKIEEKKKGEG